MTPEGLAALHARAFAGQSRGWTPSEIAALQDSPHVFVVSALGGFAMGRVVADEAELLNAFETESKQRHAIRAFLEVADDNGAALHLYLSNGYVEIARRTGYYHRSDHEAVDAVIMEKHLSS